MMMGATHYKCTKDISGRFGTRDIERSRICAALSYLVFFIPLVVFPDDRFGRYHANQALILLLLSTVGVTLVSLIPYVGLFLAVSMLAFCVILGIRGIVLALCKKAKCIPLLGNLSLIAYEPKA